MNSRFGFGSMALILLLAMSMSLAQTPEQLMARLQEKYDKIRSFSADFDQIFRSRSVELRESGIVMMKKPGKMYWEYRKPTEKLFIADGRKSYFYLPRDRQVVISELDLENADIPLLFLVGKGNVRKDFDVEFEQQESPLQPRNLLLRLKTKRPQGEFSYVVLEINPSNYLIQRLIVVEPIGNRNEYILSNLRANRRISDRQFRFEIPKEVEVLYQ